MEWSTVFTEATYTAEEVVSKLAEMKLADLSAGEYVAKDKLDKAIEKRKAAEEQLATYQAQMDGDEGLKSRVAALQAELEATKSEAQKASSALTRQQRIEQAMKRTGDPKLAKLAVLEAEGLLTDDTDFDDALSQVIESDPSYIKTPEAPPAQVTTGKETTGAAPVSPEAAAVASFAKAAGIADD